MLNKKNIILVFLLILVSGCSANYQIEIKDDKVTEKAVIVENNLDLLNIPNDSGWTMKETFDSFVNREEFEKVSYKIKVIDKKEKYGLDYSNSYELDELEKNSLINQCFDDYTLEITEDRIYINAQNFNCFDYYEYLDKVKVEIKSNYKLVNNNSDKKNNNTYIWEFTKQDSNKNIEIDLNRKEKVNFNSIYIYVGIGVSIIVLISVISFILLKNYKNNKI